MPTTYDDQKQDTDKRFDDIAQRHYDEEFANIAAREGSSQSGGSDKKPLSPEKIQQGEKQGAGGGAASKVAGAAKSVGAVAAPEAAAVGKVVALAKRATGNKKGILGTAIGAAVVVAIGLIVWTFFPHHINTLLNFYESRALRTTMKNLDDSAENFFEHYIRHHVLKALGPGCPDVRRDISCVQRLPGNDPASRAYNALSGGNVERKFFDRTGILFARDSQGRLYMTGPGLPDGGVDLNDFAEGRATLFGSLPAVRQAQARNALREALAEQTLFRRAFMRFQMRDIMKKYGILRCVIACEARENRRDRIELRKNAFKNYFFQRVLDPRNEGMRPALGCLFDPSCEPNKVVDYDGPDGSPRTEFQVKIQDLRAQLIASGRSEKRISAIAKRAELYYKTGGKNYISQLILGEVVGKKLNKAIPFYGWAVFAAEVVEVLKQGNSKLKTMNYTLISADMVATYALYRSVADEGKAGRVDAATMGSFDESLTSRAKDDNGNSSNPEATPLYENLLAQKGTSTALIDFAPTASAAPEAVGQFYKCNDGEGVQSGLLVCGEEYLRRSFAVLEDIEAIIPDALAAVASGINTIDNTIFGWVTGPLGELLAHLGNWVGLDDLLEDLTRDVIQVIRDFIFPSPAQGNTSGGRNGNLAAGGAFKVANDAAHYKLGGQALTLPEYTALQEEAIAEEEIRFANLPLKQRLFDQENPYSLVSRIALALPGDLQMSLRDAFASIIVNPFTKIMQGLASIFTTREAIADVLPQGNPWGDTSYGWNSGDPIFDTEPGAYWQQNCADGKKTELWQKSAEPNPETAQLENTTPNGCLLIETTAESLSARYQPVAGQ